METLSYCQLMERMLAAEARVVELAAENVALKAAIAEEIEVINRGGQGYCVKDGMSINPMYARGWNDHRANLAAVETPATDCIVVGIKADGVNEFAEHLVSMKCHLEAEWAKSFVLEVLNVKGR